MARICIVFVSDSLFQFHMVFDVVFKRTFINDFTHGRLPPQNQGNIPSAF